MKSSIRLKQEQFAIAIAQLILHADSLGIGVSFGDAYRDPRLHGEMGVQKGYGNKNSCHKARLAVDLNLVDPADHVRLHDYWDKLGGSKRIDNDMNHYSFEWQGIR